MSAVISATPYSGFQPQSRRATESSMELGQLAAIVVAAALGDAFGRCLHQLDRGAHGVGHIHHGERLVVLKKARITLALDGRMEDVDGVVRRAAARRGLVRDQARITQAAHVHTVVLEIPAAPALSRQLRNAVDGPRLHDRALRRVVRRRGGSERGDRAGPEDALEPMITRRFQHVQQTIHIERPAPRG